MFGRSVQSLFGKNIDCTNAH